MYVINNELYHHEVLGMKWGVRRYQSYAENPKLSDRKKAKRDSKIQKLESKRERKLARNEAGRKRSIDNAKRWNDYYYDKDRLNAEKAELQKEITSGKIASGSAVILSLLSPDTHLDYAALNESIEHVKQIKSDIKDIDDILADFDNIKKADLKDAIKDTNKYRKERAARINDKYDRKIEKVNEKYNR